MQARARCRSSSDTAVEIWASVPGFQELDLDVEDTTIEKGNWFVSGSGGSQSDTGGDTIETSYIYPTAPWWWRNSLTYPAINPASPNFDDGHAIIPAAYLYINGEQATNTGGGITVNGTLTVNGTITLP
jgi:hypothetical protein